MPLENDPSLESALYDQPRVGVTSSESESIQPESSPAPSSNPGNVGDTPGADGTPEPGEDEPQVPLPEFDERYRNEFEGLTFVGALTDSFTWVGHSFHIRTLTTGEMAEAALLAKPYIGTEAQLKALQAAMVAGCVISVDGQPVSIPLTSEPGDTEMAAKFRYVMAKWFPPVLDVIYQRYIGLEMQVREVLDAMGKA